MGNVSKFAGEVAVFFCAVAEFGCVPARSYLRRCGVLYAVLRSLICSAAYIFAETAGFYCGFVLFPVFSVILAPPLLKLSSPGARLWVHVRAGTWFCACASVRVSACTGGRVRLDARVPSAKRPRPVDSEPVLEGRLCRALQQRADSAM